LKPNFHFRGNKDDYVFTTLSQTELPHVVTLTTSLNSGFLSSDFNTLRTGDADLRFYIKLCKMDEANLHF